MNILIACHKPPGFDHSKLYKLNTNAYRKNKTRKNVLHNLENKENKVYYLDIVDKITYYNKNGKELPNSHPENSTPNWYPEWSRVPDKSMDIIWDLNCPIKHPFWKEEYTLHLTDFKEEEHALFLDPKGSIDDIWRDLIINGKRILKEGGKIITLLPRNDIELIKNPMEIKLITRIINLEVDPSFLYKIHYIHPFSKEHQSLLKDLYIISKNFLNVDLTKKYSFLVLEK